MAGIGSWPIQLKSGSAPTDFNNIIQIQGDAKNLPFKESTFDRVFCVSVLEHIEKDHSLCVREMLRVLKPGGILILTLDILLKGECKDDFFLSKEGLKDLCEKENIPLPREDYLVSHVDTLNLDITTFMSKIVKEIDLTITL